MGTLSGAGCPCWNCSAAGEGTEVADVVRQCVLVPEVGLVGPDEVALVVGRHEVDGARRVAGRADVHAERAELPALAVGGQLDRLLSALDRVARHYVARRLGARDGALQRVGAGGVGHVGELLGSDAVVLEGRTVGGVRLVRPEPRALGAGVRERRDGARVADREGRRCGVRGLRRRVLRGAHVRVTLCSLGAVVRRVEERQNGDDCGCESHYGGGDACVALRHGEAPNG